MRSVCVERAERRLVCRVHVGRMFGAVRSAQRELEMHCAVRKGKSGKVIVSATQLRVYVAVVAERLSQARRGGFGGGGYAEFMWKAFSEFAQSNAATLMQNTKMYVAHAQEMWHLCAQR